MANDKVSIRRIMAMATALGLHLVLIAVVLRPASSRTALVYRRVEPADALQVRLVSVPLVPAHREPVRLAASAQPPRRAARGVMAPRETTLQRPTPAAQPVAAQPSSEVTVTNSTNPHANAASQTALADGGFQQRLQEAQHGQAVRGIPGSAAPLAPGIQLTDPRSQGIGAVMRNAQRLFGVTNKHCIDVEAWAQLSPKELIERHLTPADVKAANEKYECNRPLGLSF